MNSGNRIAEKRQFERIVFSARKEISGSFQILRKPENLVGFRAPILNLSEGGLQIIVKKNEGPGLHVGDQLLLDSIEGHKQLRFLADIKFENKWKLEAPILANVGYGCQYQNVIPETRHSILEFIESELALREGND
jgi:hypothetical protein